MRYYPVNLDVFGRKCLVVGAGAVASRKIATLLECGAKVTVVSLGSCPAVDEMAGKGEIVLFRRAYEHDDLSGAFLVVCATDNEDTNRRVAADAEEAGVLHNIADRPELCSFVLPALVRRKDLVIAVSTAGKSPAFAKRMRKELEEKFGAEYGDFLDLMGAVRKVLLAEAHAPEEHKGLFERLIDENLMDAVRRKDRECANAVLEKVLGPGFDSCSLCPEIFIKQDDV